MQSVTPFVSLTMLYTSVLYISCHKNSLLQAPIPSIFFVFKGIALALGYANTLLTLVTYLLLPSHG